jgi:hypothetical protein
MVPRFTARIDLSTSHHFFSDYSGGGVVVEEPAGGVAHYDARGIGTRAA